MLVQVVVGILRREGNILLCQRKADARYALKWEFPGGKVEPGETLSEALARELREELEIYAEIGTLLQTDEAEYSDHGRFEVHYFEINHFQGELQNRVFNDFRWVAPHELETFDILEGNRSICRRLSEEK